MTIWQGGASVLIAVLLFLAQDWKLEAHSALFGQREILFCAPYSGSQPIHLPPVLLIAHNAGNQESTARRALSHSAPSIEIDVRFLGGRLYATHSAPSDWMPLRAYQAPRFSEAWLWSSGAESTKLDLKSTSTRALDQLLGFLRRNLDNRQISIVSLDPAALKRIDAEAPETLQFLGISNRSQLDGYLAGDIGTEYLEGVSLPEWLLTHEVISELKLRGLLIDAWTVNDPDRLVELAAQGVDAVTTDNLALFDLAITPGS